MYCSSCGTKANDGDKFCRKCGKLLKNGVNKTEVVNNGNQTDVSVNNVHNTPNYSVAQKPKVNGGAIAVAIITPIIILLIVISAFIGFALFTVSLVSDEYSDSSYFYEYDEYVFLDGDKVPTVYNVLGYRSLCSTDSDYSLFRVTKMFGYCTGELSLDDYDEYVDYLVDEEDFEYMTYGQNVVLIKDSYDEDMIIRVEIDVYNDKFYYIKDSADIGDYDDNGNV